MTRVYYAIVNSAGVLGSRLYRTPQSAQRWAKREGDSVVMLRWESEEKPLFIRGMVVEP